MVCTPGIVQSCLDNLTSNVYYLAYSISFVFESMLSFCILMYALSTVLIGIISLFK